MLRPNLPLRLDTLNSLYAIFRAYQSAVAIWHTHTIKTLELLASPK